MLQQLWSELASSLPPIFSEFRADLPAVEVHRKRDQTILSAADTAIEQFVVASILRLDDRAVIVAEEGTGGRQHDGSTGRVYVVDPIDGTAEFIQRGHLEFCSVVCVLEDRRPVAAFVLAPELGLDRTPLCATVTGPQQPILINGQEAQLAGNTWLASATRSKDSPPNNIQMWLAEAGYTIKARTTSQTLDMLRTAADISTVTDMALPSFDVFYRRDQKIWDGVAGMCLARAAGKLVYGESGNIRDEVDLDLTVPEPTFVSTFVAPRAVAQKIWPAAAPAASRA